MKIEQKTLLQSWRNELNILLQAHFIRSISIRRMNYFLGLPVILILMLVSSYIFFTINHNPDFWVKMLAGMLLLLCAILVSLQTFLKYSEQAENHRNASARYQSLHHSVDQLLAFPPKDEVTLVAWCDRLRDRWDELNLEAPNVNKTEANQSTETSCHNANMQKSKYPADKINGSAPAVSEIDETGHHNNMES